MEHATRKRFVSPGDALSVAVAPMSRVAIGPPVRLKEPTGQQSPAAVMFTCSPADADDKLAMSNGIQIVETTSLDVPGCNGDSYAVR